MSGIIERLGLPPSRRIATADQVRTATEHAQTMAQELHAKGERLRPMFDRLNLIATEYPGMTPQEVATQRPELAVEIGEALEAEEDFNARSLDLADLAGWLGTRGISFRSAEP
jgi:hypothetical protein